MAKILKGGISKMEKKFLVSGFLALLVVFLGVGLVSAYGFGNMFSSEEKQLLRDAVENDDYDSWKSLQESRITQDRFGEMRSRHQEREEYRNAIKEARELGDWDKVNLLKAEFGKGKGMNKKNMDSSNCPFA